MGVMLDLSLGWRAQDGVRRRAVVVLELATHENGGEGRRLPRKFISARPRHNGTDRSTAISYIRTAMIDRKNNRDQESDFRSHLQKLNDSRPQDISGVAYTFTLMSVNKLYFMMCQRAATPSRQVIFLPSA